MTALAWLPIAKVATPCFQGHIAAHQAIGQVIIGEQSRQSCGYCDGFAINPNRVQWFTSNHIFGVILCGTDHRQKNFNGYRGARSWAMGCGWVSVWQWASGSAVRFVQRAAPIRAIIPKQPADNSLTGGREHSGATVGMARVVSWMCAPTVWVDVGGNGCVWLSCLAGPAQSGNKQGTVFFRLRRPHSQVRRPSRTGALWAGHCALLILQGVYYKLWKTASVPFPLGLLLGWGERGPRADEG